MVIVSKKSKPAVVTTWIERYRQTIALFCNGVMPPLDLCEAWIKNDGTDDLGLQDWICCNTTIPWAQAIAILDAAHIMADQPEEGVGHFDKHGVAHGA